MLRIDVCRNENELESGFDFLLRHRRDFSPAWNLHQILHLIKGCLFQGEFIAAWNEDHEMIAILGYAYAPLGKNTDHADKKQARLVLVCISKPYRRTMLFYQGMKFLARHLSHGKIEVNKIDLVAPEKDEYLNNLFSKFATLESTVPYKFLGTLNHFSVTPEQLNRFCSRPKSRST